MKNIKISLLTAGATLALLACSSLEVSSPETENFPEGWSVAEYMSVNPDLRALQIMDQVAIMNTLSEAESDEAAFLSDTTLMTTIALNYAAFTEKNLDFKDKDKMKYLKSFNINGVSNEPEVFAKLELDTSAIARQYIVYGAIEGRPYRKCKESETALVKKGECQMTADSYRAHLYCANAGVTYCIDCKAADECPEVVVEPESSSSVAAPESSEAADEGDSSSSETAGEGGESSSSEAAGEGESSAADPGAESSSSEAAGEESSSSVTE